MGPRKKSPVFGYLVCIICWVMNIGNFSDPAYGGVIMGALTTTGAAGTIVLVLAASTFADSPYTLLPAVGIGVTC